jgi:trk system potassium uptake protein TrkA
LYNILKLPSAAKIETFSGRNFEMIEMRLKADSALDGLSIADMRSKYKARFLICAVQRGEEAYIPNGNFILRSGDKIGITAAPTEITKLLRELGILQKQARNIMILGGSRTAYYLAKRLTNAGNAVTIIERDRQLCDELCEALPKAVIINGDGAQQELLIEEGIKNLDAFVSLTGTDEENILISIFASTQGVPKTIAKVNREELASMAEKLGVDTIVSPKKLIADQLVSYARALRNSVGSNVETLYKLMDGDAEALEFNVVNDERLTDVPLKDLSIKSGILIAGIIRDRKTIIPGGNDVIKAGDKVVIIASKHKLHDLSDILK